MAPPMSPIAPGTPLPEAGTPVEAIGTEGASSTMTATVEGMREGAVNTRDDGAVNPPLAPVRSMLVWMISTGGRGGPGRGGSAAGSVTAGSLSI